MEYHKRIADLWQHSNLRPYCVPELQRTVQQIVCGLAGWLFQSDSIMRGGWNFNFMTDFYVNEDTADDDVELTISATVLPINLLRRGGEMDKESQKLLKQHKRGAWLSP